MSIGFRSCKFIERSCLRGGEKNINPECVWGVSVVGLGFGGGNKRWRRERPVEEVTSSQGFPPKSKTRRMPHQRGEKGKAKRVKGRNY